MNDGKPLDEPRTDGLPTSDSRQTAKPAGPDLRRRRLIRGAVGVAPVVLTLRSGSLAAAASCISAVQTGLSTDPNNVIQGDTTGVLPGMQCVGDTVVNGCVEAKHVQGISSGGSPAGVVQNGTPLKCGTNIIGKNRVNVAILTSTSWDSFQNA